MQPIYHKSENSRLGIYYAIYTSLIVGGTILLAIFEKLGVDSFWISHVFMLAMVLVFAGIGIAARTVLSEEFYSASRQVSPFYNGLAMAGGSFGGVVFFSFTGAVLLLGFDALALLLGWACGFFLMSLLFAPYLRKAGDYTVPEFVNRVCKSPGLQLTTALLLLLPLFFLLLAELRIAAIAASQFINISYEQLVFAGAGTVLLMSVLGGINSATWIKCAQIILVVFGVFLPLGIVSVMLTNLPLPQLSYGSILSEVAQLENTLRFTPAVDGAFARIISTSSPQPITGEFLHPLGTISTTGFLFVLLVIMAGVSVLPGTLMQAGTSTGVYHTRKSSGWGMLILALLFTAIPVWAVFIRYFILRDLVGNDVGAFPLWLERLSTSGVVFINESKSVVQGMNDVAVSRDGILLSLPVVADLPFVALVVMISAGIAAAMAAAGSHLVAVSNTISRDIFGSFTRSAKYSHSSRLVVARLVMVTVMLLLALVATEVDYDIVRIALWGITLLASTLFPLLLLVIWWRKTSSGAALVGTLSGFLIAVGYIFMTANSYMSPWFGVDNMFAAVFAMPVNFALTLLLSILWPQVDEEVVGIRYEVRVAGGRTLHDANIP
jgi:cation/acetate symporter